MAHRLLCNTLIVSAVLFAVPIVGYEKTLRKIVRSQSKMVRRPFSDSVTGPAGDTGQFTPRVEKLGKPQLNNAVLGMQSFSQVNPPHKRSKISKFISSDLSQRISSHQKTVKSNDKSVKEVRPTRNTNSSLLQDNLQESPLTNNSFTYVVNSDDIKHEVPSSKFFPSIDERELQSIESKQTITIPEPLKILDNDSAVVKGVFIPKTDKTVEEKTKEKYDEKPEMHIEPDDEKADYLLPGTPVATENYHYNATVNPYVCSVLYEAKADIDTSVKFSEFDIEPHWAVRKHFWDNIYDSRYESLMRSLKWPPLKVILVPRVHVDTIWKKNFNQLHNDSVSKIISNFIKKMQFYNNLTFTWNEVSHLSKWWEQASHKTRAAFKKLLKSGRLEITTGGWVEPDEATTHLFGFIHLMIEGHEWLKQHLNYSPKVAWLTNSVAHSSTMTYLLSLLEITQMVMTNLHFSWEQYLAEYQMSDFIWVQNWDEDYHADTDLNRQLKLIGNNRLSKHSVLTHFLQFNSAGFKACGPNSAICLNEFNFAKSNKNLDINSYNVKEKSELILEQYSKTGTITPHNVVIAPIGGPYSYESQAEFDFQISNYEKIADFVNINKDIYKATIEFGTPKAYFDTIMSRYTKYSKVKGDFFNFGDIYSGSPAYWVGYYTSRPFLKIMMRRLESTLRTTELLFSFGLSFNVFKGSNITILIDDLLKARETVAQLLDRHVMGGTLPANVLRQVHNQILSTVNKCWQIQQLTISFLTSKPGQNQSYLQKYVYREGEFISTFKTVAPEDQIYVFNSLSHERTEIIELITRHPNIRIIDHNKKEVTVQINPIWKYGSSKLIKISRRFFRINFAVIVPPMTLELFKLKETYDATQNAATIYCSSCVVDDIANRDSVFPFNIQPIQTGDIQLESYKHRLIFDEQSGFLKTVIEKETNIEKTVDINFGAFKNSNHNSGIFLFNTNVSKPLRDLLMPYRRGTKVKITMIVSGIISTELSSVYGRLLEHTVRIVNLLDGPLSNAIYLESKVDYEMSPKNRELDFYMSIQTDIGNGIPPEIVTDSNGFQHNVKVINISRRVESNVYPITSMAFIQDHRSRLTYITDHPQGVTALQEGQLIILLDRRVLYNDGRGTNEGLADSSATCHRQYILFENFAETPKTPSDLDLKLPSLVALYLSSSLNYIIDIYLVDKHKTSIPYFTFLPLIKTSFPCDVSVINYRVVLRNSKHSTPNTALLILHRHSVSCSINTAKNHKCNGESNFSLDKIFRTLRAVYKTNLAGTNKGTSLLTFSLTNFPPMEIVTLRIYF